MSEVMGITSFNNRMRKAYAAFMFVLVLLMFPYTPEPTVDAKNFLIAIAATLFSVVFVGRIILAGAALRTPKIFLLPLVAWLLLNTASSFVSPHPQNSLAELLRPFFFLLLYAVAAQIYDTPKSVQSLLAAAVLAVTVSSIYAFGQRLGIDPFPWSESLKDVDEYRNFPGTFGNPNVAGHTLLLSIVLAIYLACTRRKLIWYLCAGLLTVHLVGTEHRGGLFALVCACVVTVAILYVRTRTLHPKTATNVTLGLLAAAAFLSAAGTFSATYLSTKSVTPLDPSLLMRYNSYFGASKMILENPVAGFGPGNYKIENTPYWTEFEQAHYARDRQMNLSVHCDSLEYAIDGGLGSAFLYLLVLVTAIWYSIRLAHAPSNQPAHGFGVAMAAVFCAAAADGMFGFSLRVPVSGCLIFVLLGMLDGIASPVPITVSNSSSPTLRFGAGVLGLAVIVAFGYQARVFLACVDLQDARAATHARNFRQAVQVSGQGSALMPWSWVLPQMQADALGALGRHDDALRVFERSLANNPHYLPSITGHAVAQFRLAQTSPEPDALLASAGRTATQALGFCRYLPEAHDLLARIQLLHADEGAPEQRREMVQRAIEHLAAALEQADKGKQEQLRLLAFAYGKLDRSDDSERVLLNALTFSPDDTLTWEAAFDFAKAHRRLAVFEEKARALIAYLSAKKENTDTKKSIVAAWLGLIVDAEGKSSEESQKWFKLAVELDPASELTWGNAAQFAYAQNQVDWLKTLVLSANSTRYPPQVLTLKSFSENAGQAAPDALSTLARTMNERLHTGGVWNAQQRDVAFCEIFEQALKDIEGTLTDPGSAYGNLATLFAYAGKFESAKSHYSHAMSLMKNDEDKAQLLQVYAKILLAYDEATEAENLLRSWLSLVRNDGQLQWALADSLAKQGRKQEAIEEYNHLLREFRLDDEGRKDVEESILGLSTETSGN
jgi:tetratricopeptide (TPR) repeat protein